MRREAKRLKESLAQAKEPEPKLTMGERTYILPDLDRDAVVTMLKNLQGQRDALLQAKGRREVDSDRAATIEKELAALKTQIPEPPLKSPAPRREKKSEILLTLRRCLSFKADLRKLRRPLVRPWPV